MSLRAKVIRLAHERPELRPHLLPVLAAERRPGNDLLNRAYGLGAAHEALGSPDAKPEALAKHFEAELARMGAPKLEQVMKEYKRGRKDRRTELDGEARTRTASANPKPVPWGTAFAIRFVTRQGETLWTGDGWKHSMDFRHDDVPALFESESEARREITAKVLPYITRWQPGYEDFIK